MLNNIPQFLLFLYLPYVLFHFSYCCKGKQKVSRNLRNYYLLCGVLEIGLGLYSVNTVLEGLYSAKSFEEFIVWEYDVSEHSNLFTL